MGSLGAECVLISPLRRAVESALLLYEGEEVPLELCRYARELWFHEHQNTLGTPEALAEVLGLYRVGGFLRSLKEAVNVFEHFSIFLHANFRHEFFSH